MPRQKVRPTPTKDVNGKDDKRAGYSGAEDAATVPPPERVPSAYLPASTPSR